MKAEELLKKYKFDDIFERMKIDYYLFFSKKNKSQIFDLRDKLRESFRYIKSIPTNKNGTLKISSKFHHGCYDLWLQNFSNKSIHSMNWSEIKGCDIEGDLDEELRLTAALLWEITFYGVNEEEALKNFNKIKRTLNREKQVYPSSCMIYKR